MSERLDDDAILSLVERSDACDGPRLKWREGDTTHWLDLDVTKLGGTPRETVQALHRFTRYVFACGYRRGRREANGPISPGDELLGLSDAASAEIERIVDKAVAAERAVCAQATPRAFVPIEPLLQEARQAGAAEEREACARGIRECYLNYRAGTPNPSNGAQAYAAGLGLACDEVIRRGMPEGLSLDGRQKFLADAKAALDASLDSAPKKTKAD